MLRAASILELDVDPDLHRADVQPQRGDQLAGTLGRDGRRAGEDRHPVGAEELANALEAHGHVVVAAHLA
jgi:hypothetical protein